MASIADTLPFEYLTSVRYLDPQCIIQLRYKARIIRVIEIHFEDLFFQ